MIAFYANHQPVWELNQALIGIPLDAPLELKTRLEAAQLALTAAQAARQASKTATTALEDAAEALRSYGAGLMSTIRGFAESTGNPDVFSKAAIPPPKKPSPLPAPVPPTNVRASLTTDGTINVQWDGTVANGVTYMVFRRTDAGAGFGPQTLIGSIGARELTDAGITGCVQTVGYQIRAVRGTQFSAFSTEATIRFTPGGEGAGGGALVEAA
jgi:hypothetical protein